MSEFVRNERYNKLLEAFNALKKEHSDKESEFRKRTLALTKEKEDLSNRIQVLAEEVFWLKKELFASRSERRPIKEKNAEELDLFEGAEEAAEKSTGPSTELITYTRKKRGSEENRQKLPEHLKRVVEVVELPESERVCDECGSGLVEIGEEITEELEYVPATFYVRQIHRKKYACKKDPLHGVYRARMPERLIPKGIPGPTLLGNILISKYVDHLPLERQEQIFKRLGVRIAKSTMSDWLKTVRQKLDPLLRCLKNRMLDSRILNCDETTYEVQRNAKREPVIHGYLWSCIGDRKWVWFDWRPGRARSGPMEILQGFTGDYLQSDGYEVYNHVSGQLHVGHLACWAHARRKFVEAYESGSRQAGPVIELIAGLYRIEAEAKENGLDHAQIKEARKSGSLPILNQIKAAIEEISKSALPKAGLGKACAYALARWEQLTLYCDDGELQIDNDIVERSIRPVTLGRKNWLFSGSEDGADFAAAFYSLIETCKLHEVDPAEYMSKVLVYLADYEDEDEDGWATLLPDAYAMKLGIG